MAELTIDQIVEAIEKMTVLEVNQLVSKIEEKFGVSAVMPVAAAGAAGGAPAAAAPAAEEQTEFTVILQAFVAEKKIQTIKEIRAITGLGLKEAKDLVEGCPTPVVKDVPKAEAEKVRKQLEATGATVEVK